MSQSGKRRPGRADEIPHREWDRELAPGACPRPDTRACPRPIRTSPSSVAASTRPAAKSCSRRKSPALARCTPQLERLLTELRTDDVVVVTRLDRLARSTAELLRIAETIEEKNAGLQSIAEPWADTTSPAGRMVLTVFAGIAEFERSPDRYPNRGRTAGRPGTRRPLRAPAQTATGSAHPRSTSHRRRKIRQRSRSDLQCPCRNDLSLPTPRGALMTVHRSARTHGPNPAMERTRHFLDHSNPVL